MVDALGLETKTLRLDLKAEADGLPEGSFSATFATFSVVDHMGDVTLPGAFEDGKEVLIGAYQHRIVGLPVGKGTIRSDHQRAWVDGTFFLDTQPGKDMYATAKNAGPLLEWSYIFMPVKTREGDFDTGNGVVKVRYLEKVDVWSVDPVLKGAGIGTRTDLIKSLSREMPFSEHAAEFAAAAEAFVDRVEKFAALRAKEGRALSAATLKRLTDIMEDMRSAAEKLERALAAAEPKKNADVQREFVRFQRALALLHGVPLTT